MTDTRRFGFEVRDATDYRLVTTAGGFATRDEAETAAERKREEIARRGWNMTVRITEAYKIDGPTDEHTLTARPRCNAALGDIYAPDVVRCTAAAGHIGEHRNGDRTWA